MQGMKLGTRLTVVLIGLLLVVMVVHAVVEILKGKEHLLQMLAKDADLLVRVLISDSSSPDPSALRSFADRIAEKEEIQALRWFDSQRKVLLSVGTLPPEIVLTDVLWQQLSRSHQSVSQVYRTPGGSLFAYWRPLFAPDNTISGAVLLVLPVANVDLFEQTAIVRNLLSIAGITLLLSLAIVTLVRRWVTVPLAALLTGIEALGRGEWSWRIPIRRSDEVGQVAAAFNRMTGLLHEAQRRLIEEKEYSHSIIESITSGIIVVDTAGRITTWNRAMEEEYRIPAAEVLGRPLAEVFPALEKKGVITAVEQLCRGEKPTVQLDAVTHHIRNRGDVILNIRGYTLRNIAGHLQGAVLVIDDITEKILLQRQVVQAEKLAAVGQLTASLAHEIGTPLNIIQTRAEYMLKKLPPEAFPRAQLEKILQQIDRIVRIVRRLLDFTRQKAPSFQPVHLSVLLENLGELLAAQLRRQRITLVLPPRETLPVIEGDGDQLQQVLFNLVLNAIQAMPHGGTVTVTVRTEQEGKREKVILSVQDTGPGIPPEHLPHIFEPFFTTKPAGTGTGLGLAISRQIVQAHGGTLTVTSTVGKGTTFTLTLPRSQRDPG
ncbi:MAG: PAS domain S-box protein [Nitrospinota bacterium]|nr:MAG: PAS domain S-box protein [Nitrospinota bacterium]